jgi:hypothetical protein
MVTADAEVRIQIQGEGDMRALAQRLRSASVNGDLQKALNRNLRDKGQPVIAELRSAVQGVQVTSTKGGLGKPQYNRMLRARVASAIRMSIAYKGIRFNVEGARVGAYGAALAKYLDSELPGYKDWRHPVFGRNIWTVQHGSPWFFQTIRLHADSFENACISAINDFLAKI